MEMIWMMLNLLAAGFTFVVTLLGVWLFRKPHAMKLWRLVAGFLLSAAILPLFIFMSGLHLNGWIASLVFLLGIILGVLIGLTTKMARQGREVVGHYSWLALLFWGGSLVLSMLLNLIPSLLVAALGLLPLCLTSGIQIGSHATLAVRRLLFRALKQAVIPQRS